MEYISSEREVIVPRARFNCNGRIKYVVASMHMLDLKGINTPSFQVWHPTSRYSSTYEKIGEVQLPAGILIDSNHNGDYYYSKMKLNSSNQIEFQSGDVIGYYQPSNLQQVIWSIETNEYTSYVRNTSTATRFLALVDIESVMYTTINFQPLIEVVFGKVMLSTVCMCVCVYIIRYVSIYTLKKQIGYNYPNCLVVLTEFQTTHLSSYGNPNFWVTVANYLAVSLTSLI